MGDPPRPPHDKRGIDVLLSLQRFDQALRLSALQAPCQPWPSAWQCQSSFHRRLDLGTRNAPFKNTSNPKFTKSSHAASRHEKAPPRWRGRVYVFYGDPHREDPYEANSAVSSGQDANAKASADIQQNPDPLRNAKQLRELVQAPSPLWRVE